MNVLSAILSGSAAKCASKMATTPKRAKENRENEEENASGQFDNQFGNFDYIHVLLQLMITEQNLVQHLCDCCIARINLAFECFSE